jgi:hypothetical protein
VLQFAYRHRIAVELTSAPGSRTSKRVASAGAPGGPISRIEAARDSYPYDAVSGAHIASHTQHHIMTLEGELTSPPNKRLYELMFGHIRGTTTLC